MSTKNFGKKLVLNKRTVSVIRHSMDKVKGGRPLPPPYSEDPTYCNDCTFWSELTVCGSGCI